MIIQSFNSNVMHYLEQLFLWKHPKILTEDQKKAEENFKKDYEKSFPEGEDPYKDYKFDF